MDDLQVAELEARQKESEEEVIRLRAENEEMRAKDLSSEQRLEQELSKEREEKAKLTEKLAQIEYSKKRSDVLKKFPEVSEDLIPNGLAVDEVEKFALKLQSKFEEVKKGQAPKPGEGPKPSDFDKLGNVQPPAGTGSASGSGSAEQRLLDARKKREDLALKGPVREEDLALAMLDTKLVF